MVGTAHTYTDTNNQGHPHQSPSPVFGNLLTNFRSRASKWMGLQMSVGYHTSPPLRDPSSPVERWEESALLLHGSLLAQSCRAAAILAGVESGVQESAASLASNLSLATQVSPQLFHHLGCGIGLLAVPLGVALALVYCSSMCPPSRYHYSFRLKGRTLVI